MALCRVDMGWADLVAFPEILCEQFLFLMASGAMKAHTVTLLADDEPKGISKVEELTLSVPG